MSRSIRWMLAAGLVLGCLGCTNAETKRQQHLERAKQLSARGDDRGAILELRRAVSADPKSGEAHRQLALALERTREVGRAAQEMVRAADLMPDDVDVQLRAGRLLLVTGQSEDAAARARRVLDTDLKNVDALILLGTAAAGLKDSDAVVGQLERAIEQLPGEARLESSLGLLRASRGEVAEAEAAYKNAVAAAPRSVDARLALASYYFAVGRQGDAERTWLEALPLDETGAVTRELGLYYALVGRGADAEPYLQRAVEREPSNVVMRVSLAELQARAGRTDAALATLEPLRGHDETAASADARMALIEHNAGRHAAAYKRLDAILARFSGAPEPLAMRATLLLADERYTEAEAAARAALKVAPGRFSPLYVLGSALAAQGRTDEAVTELQEAAKVAPRAPGPKLQLTRLYLGRGQTDAALQLAREAATQDPASPLARTLLAQVYVARKDASSAEPIARALAEQFPGSPQAQAVWGDVALLNRDLPAARRAYSKSLELDPASIDAARGLMAVELAAGNVGQAMAQAREFVGRSPGNAEVLTMAARTAIAARKPEQAEPWLERAIASSPTSMAPYQLLAELYFRQERLPEALTQFEAVAKQQPRAAGPQTMMGIILQLQGKPAEARAVYERLLVVNPNAPIAANNLAMLLVESGGNLDVALNHAQAAKKLLPTDPEISDTLGLVYLKKGLGSPAVAAFDQSTRTSPENPVFWLHLGQAHALAGDKVKARSAIDRALTLKPTAETAAEARKALAELDRPAS